MTESPIDRLVSELATETNRHRQRLAQIKRQERWMRLAVVAVVIAGFLVAVLP